MKGTVKNIAVLAVLLVGGFLVFRDEVEAAVYKNLSFRPKKFRVKGFSFIDLAFRVETEWQIGNRNPVGATLVSMKGRVSADYRGTVSFLANADVNTAVAVPPNGSVNGTVSSFIKLTDILDDVQVLLEGRSLQSVIFTAQVNTSLGSFPVERKIPVSYQ